MTHLRPACAFCGYIYDTSAVGRDGELVEETMVQELPDGTSCPHCGAVRFTFRPCHLTPRASIATHNNRIRQQDVAERAYHIWQRRSYVHGRDKEDWLQAEKELAEEFSQAEIDAAVSASVETTVSDSAMLVSLTARRE